VANSPLAWAGEKAAPLAAGSVVLWWGSEAGAAQYPAHGGCADAVSEAAQFAVDAAESPAGILGAEAGDELAQILGQGWTS
jgi:hypothetical protein